MRKTGPNDIRHVVWAKGTCFFFFHVLLILTYVFCFFRFYLCYKGTGRVGLAGDDDNGSRRCKMHLLDQRYVFF